MARKEGDATTRPPPRTWTEGRTARFTDPDEIRFILEGMASGEEMVSDALRFKAIEMLANLTGLGATLPPDDDDVADQPDVASMTDAQLLAWIRRGYTSKGERKG